MPNKPHIDWKKIIWKCQCKTTPNSTAYWFATEQCLLNAINEIKEIRRIKATGQAGHKGPRKTLYKAKYYSPTDLNCDDPYYDGVPILP